MLRSAPQPSLIPVPAIPAGSGVRQRATSMKHDANRPRKLWNNAVSATKGLFHQPARPVPDASARCEFVLALCTICYSQMGPISVPLDAERRKVARRSVSVPALKAKASASKLRQPAVSSANAHARAQASPLSSHSSPRRPKNAVAHGRPVISKPSLPQHLDSLNTPSHSKLAYPLLSSAPSTTGPTFQYKPAFIQSTSKL